MDELLMVIRAYVGEWGPDNVLITLPRSWANFSWKCTGKELSKIYFGTTDTIEVSAMHGGFVYLNYSIDAQKIINHEWAASGNTE